MSEMIKVAVDAMGGEIMPRVWAHPVPRVLSRHCWKVTSSSFTLPVKKDAIRQELSKYTYPEDRVAGCSGPVR